MGRQVETEQQRTNELGAEGFGLEISMPKVDATAVVPLNYQKAFASFSETEKQQIMALSDSIDLTKRSNVMNYGATPFIDSFEECGALLKKERGSSADQAVIKEVIDLSKKVAESNEDFNIILKEPNALRKAFLKLFFGGTKTAEKNIKKIRDSAITAYDLVGKLKVSYNSWLEILESNIIELENSAASDISAIKLLEKYIIAGKIAEPRLKNEIEQLKKEEDETGLLLEEYGKMQQGYDIFSRRMGHLEEMRIMYRLIVAEVMLMGKSNTNMQEIINTQAQLTTTLITLQIRNAIINEKFKEVVEGHQAITKLSDELVKKISENIGRTAEETEKLIYASICDPEVAKEAVENIYKSCERIRNTEAEMMPKLKEARERNDELMKKLEPIVNLLKLDEDSEQTLKIESQNTSSIKSVGTQLKF